jgi:hypothetical protein
VITFPDSAFTIPTSAGITPGSVKLVHATLGADASSWAILDGASFSRDTYSSYDLFITGVTGASVTKIELRFNNLTSFYSQRGYHMQSNTTLTGQESLTAGAFDLGQGTNITLQNEAFDVCMRISGTRGTNTSTCHWRYQRSGAPNFNDMHGQFINIEDLTDIDLIITGGNLKLGSTALLVGFLR